MGNDEIYPFAAAWIATNVVPYFTSTNISDILVGHELFADETLTSTWLQVVPAILNLHTSLKNRNMTSIRVSTAAEFSILAVSYPPSNGVFRTNLTTHVMTILFQSLDSIHAHLFVNVYPYFSCSANSQYVQLEYALFAYNGTFTTDGSYEYTNKLEDAMAAAMASVGYGNVRFALSETGWPTMGDSNELGASVASAQTYNQNLVNHILSNPTQGTVRLGVFIPTFIFALFNENEKPRPTTERNWGLLHPNRKPLYPIDIQSESSSSPGSPPGSGGSGASPGVAGLSGPSVMGNPAFIPCKLRSLDLFSF